MRLPRRFDDAMMSPPDAQGISDATLHSLLRNWCEGGTSPTLTEPLRVASLAPHAALDDVACEMDGTHELARLGRWQGLLWRLQILWHECVSTRGAQPDDPWDCGWWREGPLAAAKIFRPRRATLLLVRETDPAVTAALLSTLQASSPSYAKPVRVLVVSESAVIGISRL